MDPANLQKLKNEYPTFNTIALLSKDIYLKKDILDKYFERVELTTGQMIVVKVQSMEDIIWMIINYESIKQQWNTFDERPVDTIACDLPQQPALFQSGSR
jgi:hypothetical protein